VKHRNAKGFTLIELMIVLVIMGIALSLAIPGFSDIRFSTKLRAYAQEMVAAVYLARTESIKRNSPVILCPAADPNAVICSTGVNGSWVQGWIVLDFNNGTVLKRSSAVGSGFVFSGKELGATADVDSITFNASGLVTPPTKFTVCKKTPEPGNQEREIQILPSGQVEVDTTRTGTCN
jgi:prepilin-type N-terminal cleavage/methylation domain-containing protein